MSIPWCLRSLLQAYSVIPRSALKVAAVAVILAVKEPGFGGDGWESNPPRTPQQRPANGFEDRVSIVLQCPRMSGHVEETTVRIR